MWIVPWDLVLKQNLCFSVLVGPVNSTWNLEKKTPKADVDWFQRNPNLVLIGTRAIKNLLTKLWLKKKKKIVVNFFYICSTAQNIQE